MILWYGEERRGEISIRGVDVAGGGGDGAAGGADKAGGGRWDALLMSRLDFDVRVLDVPPVSEKDIEGLIRLKLRSIYPGNPNDTAFDYCLTRHAPRGTKDKAAHRQAIVFISRRKTVDAYRDAAKHRPLVLPYQLVLSRVPARGDFRAWVCHEKWAELLVFRDGVLLSSTTRRLTPGVRFDFAAEESGLPEEERSAPHLVAAPREDLEEMARANGALYVSLEEMHKAHGKPAELFPVERRKALVPSWLRLSLLGAAVVVLGLLVFLRYVNFEEGHGARLKALADSLEKGNQEALTAQRDMDALRAEKARLDARAPRDVYALLSELSVVLGNAARIQVLSVRDDGFQLDAVGTNPLLLMEGLKARPAFSDMKLSQVVPDPATGKERFSISGVFHGR